MKKNDWKERLNIVYSTNPDFSYETEEENVADAVKVIELLVALARKGELIDAQNVGYFILSVRE